jgi:hypothetical protein
MNPKNSKSRIKRRNFFLYLGAGAAGVFALTKIPLKIFQQKIKSETGVKVKPNPYAVKRDTTRGGKNIG